MEDDYQDDNYQESRLDDSEGTSERCRQCEEYQQRIYELNARLRGKLADAEYRAAKQSLDDIVQLQLKHQREHL